MKTATLCSVLFSVCILAAASLRAQQAQTSGNDERLKKILERFPKADLNEDGVLTRDEANEYRAKSQAGERRQRPQAPQAQNPAPTHADVQYGDHEKQAFDIWLAESKDGKPTPLAIYIHGGGFRGGDKKGLSRAGVQSYLDKGISFASMNYRLSDVGPYPMQMLDAARGLQFIRSKAGEWNLDKEKIACYGGSAGAGISLWLAFHDDLADPGSNDPVARESTRIVAAGTMNGQSTYDMRTFRDWFETPDLPPHEALVTFYAVESDADWESDRVKKLMKDASAITHLDKDDKVPIYMTYGGGDTPVDKDTSPGAWVHHVRLGLKLQEAMKNLGLECTVVSKDHPDDTYSDIHDFLQTKLTE